jgi:hypothetical protein
VKASGSDFMSTETKKAASGPFRFKKDTLLKAALLLLAFGILLLLYVSIKGPALDITDFTLERQSASFLLVSTLKSSLAVIEGSDIGIGFRLEVGDIVQSTYDLVDFTWKILLYGILLITFSKILFESDLINIGLYILAVGFLLNVSGLFIQRYKEKILSFGTGVIIAGMIVSFYIPVSTLVSFRACEYFVGHIEKDMNHQMQEVLEDWEKFKSELSLRELKSSVQIAASFVKALFLKLTRIMITFTCLIIIRYLLFPVIVAYGFFILSKAFLKRKFE